MPLLDGVSETLTGAIGYARVLSLDDTDARDPTNVALATEAWIGVELVVCTSVVDELVQVVVSIVSVTKVVVSAGIAVVFMLSQPQSVVSVKIVVNVTTFSEADEVKLGP